MAFLEISGLQKYYGPTHVVRDFDLDVEKGEFVSFLGPSGCGKTTTLRMVAGFETPSAGSIRIDGRDVVNLKPNQRNIGMVFQAYALFPNLTVAQNVAFGLRIAGTPKAEAAGPRRRDARHHQASPTSAPATPSSSPAASSSASPSPARSPRGRSSSSSTSRSPRSTPRSASRSARRSAPSRSKLGITTIYVTHDQEEALSMSDRIVVMNAGVAEQIGDPFAIYNRPATRLRRHLRRHAELAPAPASPTPPPAPSPSTASP